MRRPSVYRFLTLFCLGVAATAVLLAGIALGLDHGFEAGAAGLCAAAFFIPGLLFLRYWGQLESRELALARVAELAEKEGVADAKTLGALLDVPEADVARIVRIAIREGHLQGAVDERGRFVAASAPRCPACGKPGPRTAAAGPCPSCGASMAGGV